MRRIGSTNAGCLVTSSIRSPSRYTDRPSRRLATYASPLRMSAPTLPQAANNDKPQAAMIMSGPVRRPPLAVVLVAVSMLALGETAGAVMSRLKPEIQRYAAARVTANAGAHGFSGSAEYDDEVRDRAIFAAEAGLSFFHVHAEGVGLVLFFASTLAAATVPWRRARPRMTVAAEPHPWRVPPRWVLLVAVLSIVCAEIGGASMARFKVELTRWARDAMLARPAVHGLVGVRDVDERILDEALVKFDAGLRLFHMHAEGMGLVIIATTMVAATVARAGVARRVIIALLTTGGAGYPVGYLVWSALIPAYGLERAKTIAEWLVWIPFGSATIVALWWLTGLLALRMIGR